MSNGSANRKIIEVLTGDNDGKPLVSLEFFPPRTEEGIKSLYARMERMKNTLNPAFTDITWGAGGSTADLSLDLALRAASTGHVSNMHLTCTNIQGVTDPKKAIRDALQAAYDGGIRNIVALRGDPPAGETEWKATEGGFTCALDLVKYIRELYEDTFGIAVAGYPEGHPNAITEVEDPTTLTESEKMRSSSFDGKTYCCLDEDYKKELDYLKKKVEAGADFIITQMFFDSAVFKQFVKDCRTWGITCPIVPGLMCINAYPGFVKMTKFCKTRVPEALGARMEELKDDAAALKKFGVDFGVQLCKELLSGEEPVTVFHFYTLNLEKVVYGILDGLGLTENALAAADEADAAAQVAKGSAWARVGDKVKCIYGEGVVLELDDKGTAKVQIDSWVMTKGQKPVAFLQKGQYSKIF